MEAELEIQAVSTSEEIPAADQFQRWADAALPGKNGQCNLSIRIVDEPEALRFNREYRGRDSATNVLSFPAELPVGLPAEIKHSLLGDLLICAPVVVREAMEQRRPVMDHWAHLTIHGILHLLGYNHERPDEAEVMESLEVNILSKLGISDPYEDLT